MLDADPQGTADAVAARLDMIAAEYERGWQGRPTQDGGLRLWRTLRGVEEVRVLDGFALRSGEARRLASMTGGLQEVYGTTATLVRKDREQPIYGPTELLDAVMREGEKGLSLQRYKGLGEMNPEQLWETTLDPEARTLLQVQGRGPRRGRRRLHQADGRRGRAAARVHPDQRAERGEPGLLRRLQGRA